MPFYRLMYDVSPNTPFNIVYELGDFWHKNHELKSQCTEYLNETWWSDVDAQNVTATDSEETTAATTLDFVSVHIESPTMILMVTMTLMVCLKVMASTLRRNEKFIGKMEENLNGNLGGNLEGEMRGNGVYGAV